MWALVGSAFSIWSAIPFSYHLLWDEFPISAGVTTFRDTSAYGLVSRSLGPLHDGRSGDATLEMSKPLRILMLIPELGFGGAERSFLRLAHHFSKVAEVTIGVMGQPYAGLSSSLGGGFTELPVLRLDGGLASKVGRASTVRR